MSERQTPVTLFASYTEESRGETQAGAVFLSLDRPEIARVAACAKKRGERYRVTSRVIKLSGLLIRVHCISFLPKRSAPTEAGAETHAVDLPMLDT